MKKKISEIVLFKIRIKGEEKKVIVGDWKDFLVSIICIWIGLSLATLVMILSGLIPTTNLSNFTFYFYLILWLVFFWTIQLRFFNNIKQFIFQKERKGKVNLNNFLKQKI